MTGTTLHSVTDPLPIGTQIMEHTVIDVVGRGGFGIVYLVEHPKLRIRAAVKEFCPSRLARRGEDHSLIPYPGSEALFDEIRTRFDQSARALCRLSHPNIVGLRNQATANNTSYLLMNYVAGQAFDKWVDSRIADLSRESVKAVVEPILDAISYLHAKRMIHRDISPDNILINENNEPVIVDFGTLKAPALEEKDRAEDDPQSAIISKPFFSPPEQMTRDGKSDYTFSGDIYSIAATIYDALAGRAENGARRLVSADRRQAIAAIHPEKSSLQPLAEVTRIDMGPEFAQAIDAALSLNPLDRPQSIETFRKMMFPAVKNVRGGQRNLKSKRSKKRPGFAISSAAFIAATAAAALTLPGTEHGTVQTEDIPAVVESGDLDTLNLGGDSTKTDVSPEYASLTTALPSVAEVAAQISDVSACGNIDVEASDGVGLSLVGQVPKQETLGRIVQVADKRGFASVNTSALVVAGSEPCDFGAQMQKLTALASVILPAETVIVETKDGPVTQSTVIRADSQSRTDFSVALSQDNLPHSGHVWTAAMIQGDGTWQVVPLGSYASPQSVGWSDLSDRQADESVQLTAPVGHLEVGSFASYPRLFAADGENYAMIFGFVTEGAVSGLPSEPTPLAAALREIENVIGSRNELLQAAFVRHLAFE